jgi:hypothetical protein
MSCWIHNSWEEPPTIERPSRARRVHGCEVSEDVVGGLGDVERDLAAEGKYAIQLWRA